MPDDPVQILREAGIECPEVDVFLEHIELDEWVNFNYLAVPAVLALAELVAKYKRQRDEACDLVDAEFGGDFAAEMDGLCADVERPPQA